VLSGDPDTYELQPSLVCAHLSVYFRDDPQPATATDAVPVPAALLLPDAIKWPYGFLLKTVKHTLLLLDRYDLKLRQGRVI